MAAYVGNTDFEWFQFLAAQRPDEVNFWQPGGNRAFRVCHPGEPFFFRLKAPRNMIAGFGFFVRHSILPVRLAWEAFGQKNGAASFEAMCHQIEKYRNAQPGLGRSFQIGCIVLAHPVFFSPDDWIPEPEGWTQNIVQGKGIDITVGDGLRIWRACAERRSFMDESSNLLVLDAEKAKFGQPTEIQRRLGQGGFRISLIEAYDRACAVSREHSLPVLEAAHIKPYAGDGTHSLGNGLLLRSDIHRLFDEGYVTITEDLTFKVGDRLKKDFDNGKMYYALQNKPVHLPKRQFERPELDNLKWHREERFIG